MSILLRFVWKLSGLTLTEISKCIDKVCVGPCGSACPVAPADGAGSRSLKKKMSVLAQLNSLRLMFFNLQGHVNRAI